LLGRKESTMPLPVDVEKRLALQQALNLMDATDREILSLRHYEELSNQEAAKELGIDPIASGKRYTRALQQLQRILTELGLVM